MQMGSKPASAPHSCRGFVVCVFGYGLGLHSANPGGGTGYPCSCACATSTNQFLAGILTVCVCVWALRVPRQSWLGCLLHLFGCVFWLHQANPGSDLWFAFLGTRLGFCPPILAWVWVVCVPVWVQPVPRQSWLELVVYVF